MKSVNFGYRNRSIRLGNQLALRLPWRGFAIGIFLLSLAAALAILAIGIGEYPISPGEVVGILLGGGEDFSRMVVIDWRMPVIGAAVLFGALLGIGGAIFQSLTRNPLGSPDVIGFSTGSYTAVVITILVLGTKDTWALALAAIVGGLATAMCVYLLAYRRGVHGFRLIVVGIGVTAILGSVNAYLITRANHHEALAVGFWGAGTISRVTWTSLAPAGILAMALLAAAAMLAPAMRQLEMGDDAAIAHGVKTTRTRLALMIVGVATTAVVTAAAGPIAFIALVAPQLARRLTGSPGVSITSAAAMGAALTMVAHLLSLLASLSFRPIPIGLITVCLGGGYLIVLLVQQARQSL